MEAKDLKAACRKFEHEHGVEAFLDAIAEIMTDRMAAYGLEVHFFDDADQRADAPSDGFPCSEPVKLPAGKTVSDPKRAKNPA